MEKGTVSVQLRANANPLAPYTLESLLEGAARMRPDAVALGGDAALTFAKLAQRVAALAGRLAVVGLAPGETVLVLAAPRTQTVVAVLAASRLGLAAALAPLDAPPAAVALMAGRINAVAILAGGPYGTVQPVETAFLAASLSNSIRLIGLFEGDAGDGAVDLTPAACDGDSPAPHAVKPAQIITFERAARHFTAVRHRPATLVAAGLDLITRCGLSVATPIVSTIAPASLAGLVAGPLAMLLCGAALHFHGPFDSTVLRRQLAACDPGHLLAPERTAAYFAASRLIEGHRLLLLSRWDAAGADFSPPHALDANCPVTDLHAFGERALLASPRDAAGRPCAILDTPHLIEIGGETIVALAGEDSGDEGLVLSGAAVTLREPDA